MKTKQILTLVLCVLATQVFAQTKLIAFKSHSGSRANFKHAHEKNLFNMAKSNFGQINFTERERLDSVIFLSDTVTVLVSAYAWNEQRSRDTLYNHPLFTAKNSVEKIKNTVKQQRYYVNPIETVAFVWNIQNQSGSQTVLPEINVNEIITENVALLLPPYKEPYNAIENRLPPVVEEIVTEAILDTLNQPQNPSHIIPEPTVFELDSGMNTTGLFDMTIFPNPARGNTTLAFSNPDNETFSIRVYDARGRIVLTANKLKGTQFEMDISKFERGVYVAELIIEDRSNSKRFIVQ